MIVAPAPAISETRDIRRSNDRRILEGDEVDLGFSRGGYSGPFDAGVSDVSSR
jgi:hypothetical protein